MKKFFCSVFLLAGMSAAAQDWFSQYPQHTPVDGYIITIAGDTIQGKIDFDFPVVMQKRLVFFNVNNPRPVIFQPEDIRGYSIGTMKWESITAILTTYNGPIKFNRFGILYSGNGPLLLYRLFPEKDKIKKNLSSSLAETIHKGIALQQDEKSFDHLYLKKSENPAISINDKSFKKDFISIIPGLVSDHSELVKKIQGKEYLYADLKSVVAEYNGWYLKKIYGRDN